MHRASSCLGGCLEQHGESRSVSRCTGGSGICGETPPSSACSCSLPAAPRWALHAGSPSGKTQLQPKQSTLCNRHSLLLERRVPARPSPVGASQINEWLGFSTQSSEPSSPHGSRSACTSGRAGVSPPWAAWDHSQARGPFGKGKLCYGFSRRFLLESSMSRGCQA